MATNIRWQRVVGCIRALALGLGLLVAASARASDVLSIVGVALDRPTLHALGVQVLIADDDDRDAGVAVRYRQLGCGDWLAGPPLFRVHPETIPAHPVPQQFAGSIFDLVPGTTYEIELHAVDADGPVDETRTLTGTTRSVPRADPLTPAIRAVTTAAELRAALGGAAPGDVISLRDGLYAGTFFSITASGTADQPIVVRGQSQAGTILDGGDCAGCNVLEVYGGYVHIENLTIQNGIRGLRFQGAGTRANVVRRVTIRDVVHGIGSGVDQEDFYVCDNVVAGRLAWPLIYTDDGGLHADDQGIRVDGDGHVVCHNRVSGFGDSMINFKDGGRSYDFYGNEIFDIYGDGTELDRGEGNVRCWGNRWTNVFTAISLQPTLGGPVYVLRNSIVNVASEQLKIKMTGSEPSGMLIYHNTFVSPDLALNLQTPITAHNFVLANNVFVGPNPTVRGFTVDFTADVDQGTFDYNGYAPDGRFWFGDVGPIRRSYLSFAAAQAAGAVEGNGVLLTNPMFTSGLTAPTTYTTALPAQDLELDGGSNGLDRGLVLPGINDDFTGSGPDLGARERGCPVPIYGPRLAGTEATTNPVRCRLVPCSPGGDVLRNGDIDELPPIFPTVATAIATLRASSPYLTGVSPGVDDPDGTVLAATRPLIFYELVDPVKTLLLTRSASRVRIDWR